MALLEIPTRNDLPTYEMQVQLEGTYYTLQFNFNPRCNNGQGKWQLALADKNRNLLVASVPVAVNWPLFDRFFDQDGGNPPGTFMAFDTSGNGEDPGQFDLGNRVRLFYIESGTKLFT